MCYYVDGCLVTCSFGELWNCCIVVVVRQRCWYSGFVCVVMSWNFVFLFLLLPRFHGDGSSANS